MFVTDVGSVLGRVELTVVQLLEVCILPYDSE